MKNALNINKTVANQYLNPIILFGAKPLMILSILLTAMFILAACGGGAAAPAASGGGGNPCATNPFANTGCATTHAKEREVLINRCLAEDTANDALCASAKAAVPCIEDPSHADCPTNEEFIAAIEADNTNIQAVIKERATFCNDNPNTADICEGVQSVQGACTVTAPFANDLCDTVTGIAGLRTTYCTTAGNLWEDACDAGEATYGNATALRNTACLESGVTADTSCASRANVREACNADPFTQTTTTNADLCTGSTADTGGTTYADARAACAVQATSFDTNCDSQDTIGDVKLARDMACAESGTAASTVNDCATRPNIIADCDADDPFANTGCDTATHILAENNKIRTTYCTTATTSFDADCTDGTDGMVNVARASLAMKCLTTPGDSECTSTYVDGESGTTIAMCSTDPFLSANGCDANDAFGAIRTGICTTGTTIFNTGCEETTHGEVNAARASFVATCKANPTASVCTTTFVNGVDGLTVAQCNDNVFDTTNDCNTHPAFNAERISICTTEATSFTAGCVEATHGEVNAAQAKLAATCATTPGSAGCDTRIDGSAVSGGTGPTVAGCNTNPFETGCATNGAFDARRMSFCTTDATSFTAGCEEATHGEVNAARANLITTCATTPGSSGCDARVDGSVDNGSTVDQCNENPFLTDCDTNGAFASAQTARTELCVATNDPFNTACNIDNFADNNDDARDTYCLTIAVENDANCAGTGSGGDTTVRTTEICGATETHNPFAPLCGDSNTADRDTFCGLGQMQTDNLNCSEDVMVQCNRNPFGTNLGKAGTIDCTTDYAGQRKILADACRPATVDTTLAVFANDGATCTDAINNCNANPFGTGCDPLAFADARTSYCTSAETTWNASCDASVGDVAVGNAVTAARSSVCAANGALTGATAGEVADGDSLFHAACLALTATADAMTITDAQTIYCAADDNPWQANCDTAAGLSNDNAVITARNDVCLSNGAITTASETLAAGDSLFDTLCGTVAGIAAVRETECETDTFAWHTGCNTFVVDSSDAEVIAARADICFGNEELNRGGGTVIAAGYSFFDALCDDLTNSAGDAIADVRLAYCEMDSNAWRSGCGTFVTDNDVTDARTRVCRANAAIFVGTSATDVAFNVEAGKSLFSGLCLATQALSDDPTKTIGAAQMEWCTNAGDNDANIFDPQCVDSTHGDVDDARDTACAQDTAHESVGTNNCVSRAEGICGDDDNPGSNPFAAICGVATQNINYFAELADSQQDYCGLDVNNDKGVCDTTVANVCAPGGTELTTNGIFDAICARDAYNTARNSYCSATTDADEGEAGGNCVILKVALCDGTETTDTPYSVVCDPTNNVAAQEAFCGLDGNSGATGCAATIMAACDVTTGNPFDVLCTEPNTADRVIRADACRQPSPTVECDPEVMACNADPFGDTAPTDGESCNAGTNADVYVNAREAYCTVGASIFNGNCDGDAHGATADARLAACSENTLHSSVGTDNCSALAGGICGVDAQNLGTNPFAAICTEAMQNSNSAAHQAAVDSYCADDTGGTVRRNELTNALCADVTVADWVGSFTGDDALATDPTAGADASADNQFLAITTDTISTEGVTSTSGGGGADPTVTTLNFTQLTYEGVNLATADTNDPKRHTAEDGLAFFTGYFGTETEESAYAGIFGTTDLGALITQNDLNVTWHGALRIQDGADIVEADIALDVTFDGTVGTISGFFTNINTAGAGDGTKDLYILGAFDDKGVITTADSSIHYGAITGDMQVNAPAPDISNGVLSGIIGQDGAIGVFYNRSGTLYVGGFAVTGDCSVDAFSANCPLNTNVQVLTKFCTNTTDNAGRNPHNTMCADGTHGNVVMAREISCGTSDPTSEPCETLVNNLCTGSNSDSILTSAGAGGYNCYLDSAFLSNRQTYCAGTGNSETGTCPSVLADVCALGNSVLTSVTSGDVTYNCSTDNDYTTVRQTYCAGTGNSETGTCPSVLAGVCALGNSVLTSVTSGDVTYNCSTDNDYTTVRQTYCAGTGNSETGTCPSVLADVCALGNSVLTSVTSGDVTYNCSTDNDYTTVRQTYCAGTGNSETGTCPSVLAGVCALGNSVLTSVTSGDVTYNCSTDNDYTTVRQTYCAGTGNSETGTCPSVLAGVCALGNSVLTSVTSGDVTYNCSTDNDYTTVRQTFCAGTGNSETGTCPSVLADVCALGNSVLTSVTSGDVTYNCSTDNDYTTVRQTFCAGTGNSETGTCPSVLADVCALGNSVLTSVTSGDVTYNCSTDNDYTTVRQTFCAGTGNSETGTCPSVLADVCALGNSVLTSVTSGDVTYNCSTDNDYTTVRQTYCAGTGNSETGTCPSVLAGVCALGNSVLTSVTSGDVTYNCSTDNDYTTVRQTFCAGTGNSETGTCPSVLADVCALGNSVLTSVTSGDVTYNCSTDNDYTTVRQTYCAGTGNSETGTCPSVLAGVCALGNSVLTSVTSGDVTYNCSTDNDYTTVRQTYCAGTGNSETGTCPSVLAGVCALGNSVLTSVTSGDVTYNCSTDNDYTTVRQTYCAGTGNSETGTCPSVLADVCALGNSVLTSVTSGDVTYNCSTDNDYTTVRQTYCAGTGNSETGTCPSVLADVCALGNSVLTSVTSGDVTYNCSTDNDYTTVRQTYCAGTGNSETGTCPSVLADVCALGNSVLTSVTSGDVTYNCSTDNDYTTVRQTFCAGTGNSETGTCPSVLADVCALGNSVLTSVTSGDVTYNCSTDNDYTTVRQTYCAGTGNSETGTCPSVLAGICSGSNSVLTSVTSGDVTYNCSTDNDYNSDRETACSTGGSGDTSQCASTVLRVCTGNGIFGAVCLRADVTANYVNARGAACLAGTAIDPVTSAPPTNCGTKDSTAGTYIHTYCQQNAQASNHRDCPNTYGTAQGNATATVAKLTSTASAGKDRALNSTGTALLSGTDVFVADGAAVDEAAADSGSDAGRTNFFVDKARDIENTNLNVPTPLSTGYFTLNSLDPVNDNDTSGFAFARSEYVAGGSNLQDRRYVALLAGTDLGAPVRDLSGNGVVWKAKFGGIVNAAYITETDFDLTVNFDAKTLTASFDVTGFGTPVNINGGFTANGVLYGTLVVNSDPRNDGTLTGLIGADGAVGIFKSHDGAPNPYVGGFVAVPGFADVTADGFKAKARDRVNAGLLADSDRFSDAGSPNTFPDSVNFIEGGGIASAFPNATAGNTLLLAHEISAGDKGGVAFTYGPISGGGETNYHVGLLSNTNVGPALNGTSTVAGDWNGFIQGILDGNLSDASQAITFSVDFGDKSFKVKDGTSTTLSAAFGQVTVNGKFLANGVVYGTVDFATGTTNTGTGTLTGLIGQKALIGAFAAGADGTDKPYVGGFTASAPGNTAPPTECSWDADPFGTDCADMMDIDNDDDQTRACIEGTNAARVDFSTRCVMNMEVTNRVCSGSGIRANPFNTDICNGNLTEKKNPLFRIV